MENPAPAIATGTFTLAQLGANGLWSVATVDSIGQHIAQCRDQWGRLHHVRRRNIADCYPTRELAKAALAQVKAIDRQWAHKIEASQFQLRKLTKRHRAALRQVAPTPKPTTFREASPRKETAPA